MGAFDSEHHVPFQKNCLCVPNCRLKKSFCPLDSSSFLADRSSCGCQSKHGALIWPRSCPDIADTGSSRDSRSVGEQAHRALNSRCGEIRGGVRMHKSCWMWRGGRGKKQMLMRRKISGRNCEAESM